MSESVGYWYDRIAKRWIKISDHATDAWANPEKFGTTKADLETMIKRDAPRDHVWMQIDDGIREGARAAIIKHIASKSYIRVRHIFGSNAYLGWQFAGNPCDALTDLQRYMKRKEVGPVTVVTFTDFGLGVSVQDLAKEFGKPPGSAVQKLINTWKDRYTYKGKRIFK